jgi:hypothetical protein
MPNPKGAPTGPGDRIPCPACGAPAGGRYCPECGAVTGDASCSNCQAILTPGARFCHECGTPAGGGPAATATPAAPSAAAKRARKATPPAPAAPRNNLPFILGGTAFVVLVVIFAAQRAGEEGPVPMGAPAVGGGAGAVDISAMSPRERASRLFDRIMRLHSQGKTDSVQFFSTMALGVYETLGPLDADLRYDYGRVAEVSGNLDIARAQADTILQQSPTHLLGLILGAAVASASGDTQRRDELERRLLAAESTELAKNLEEYDLHRLDIETAIAAARAR